MKKYLYTFILFLLGVTCFLTTQAINIGVNSSKSQSTWYNSNISGTFTVNGFTSFDWREHSWSRCSKSCGGGTRIRTVYCRGSDGKRYDDDLCSGGKPHDKESCNTDPCGYPGSTCPSGMTITATKTSPNTCTGERCSGANTKCTTGSHSSFSAAPVETCGYDDKKFRLFRGCVNRKQTCKATIISVLCSP